MYDWRMTNPSNETYLVELTSMVYGGAAMGRLEDGRAVFVPYGLPGEQVRVRLVQEKRGHAQAELVEVVRAAEERIVPRCVHFTTCGGCAYQHMPYEKQLEIKTNVVREQLRRIAAIAEPPVAAMVPSPQPWNYRNTVQFHLTPGGRLGFLAADSHHVVPIRECHLPVPTINEIWPQLEFEAGAEVEQVELRCGMEEDVLILMEGEGEVPPDFVCEQRLSVVYSGPEGAAVMAGEEYVVMQVLERPFKVSVGSFFQVNIEQAGAMVQYLLEHLELTAETTLLDLYCGVGLFSAFMAPKVKRCIGIEVSPWACEDYGVNLDEFDNVELYVGAAEDVLPGVDWKVDVAVVDPPRSGLEKEALDALVKIHPAKLAYVSCDPSTLARDTQRLLAAGYQLELVTPFDLFPQTSSIESISFFVG